MNLVKSLIASAAIAASFGAQALVTGSLGGAFGPLIPLSTENFGQPCVAPGPAGTQCALGGVLGVGGIATISGGTIYQNDMNFADDVVAGVPFLAAGPTSTNPAVMTFNTAVSYFSFLWGSPDLYNSLTVTEVGGGTFSFTVGNGPGNDTLEFPEQNGNQSVNQQVQFFSTLGIQSVTYNSASRDAFESTHYSITPIPEPETYALMLAGLAALGFVGRRRRQA